MRRSLYEEIGGATEVAAVVDVFYDRLSKDERVLHFFEEPERNARLRASLRDYLSQLLGGPERYDGPDLAAAHAALPITDDQVDVVLGHLAGALAAAGVAADPARRVEAIAMRLWFARQW